MTSLAKSYAAVVIATGLLLVAACCAQDFSFPQLDRYLLLVALSSTAAALKVKLPALNGTISPNFVFILIGVAGFTLTETLLAACFATLIQCVWKRNTPLVPVQALFNMAVTAIGAVAAFRAPTLFGLPVAHPAALAVSASTIFICNTLLVAEIISLTEQRPALVIWRHCYLWSFPYYLAGAGIAGAVTACSVQIGGRSLLLLPLVYLTHHYYRLCIASRAEIQPAG